MKKSICCASIIFAVLLLFTTNSFATLLGLDIGNPDILSDSTGKYVYTAYNDTITFTATALTVTFDGSTLVPIDNGSYFSQFHIDSTGAFSGGISGNDLEIYGNVDVDNDGKYDYTGILISGDVTDFGYLDSGPYAYFDYTFDVTGGSLASFYTDGIGADIVSSDCSTFSDNWNVSHGGIKVKHDTGPDPVATPIPPSWLLMMMSLGVMCISKQQYI